MEEFKEDNQDKKSTSSSNDLNDVTFDADCLTRSFDLLLSNNDSKFKQEINRIMYMLSHQKVEPFEFIDLKTYVNLFIKNEQFWTQKDSCKMFYLLSSNQYTCNFLCNNEFIEFYLFLLIDNHNNITHILKTLRNINECAENILFDYISSIIEILNNILECNPEKRITEAVFSLFISFLKFDDTHINEILIILRNCLNSNEKLYTLLTFKLIASIILLNSRNLDQILIENFHEDICNAITCKDPDISRIALLILDNIIYSQEDLFLPFISIFQLDLPKDEEFYTFISIVANCTTPEIYNSFINSPCFISCFQDFDDLTFTNKMRVISMITGLVNLNNDNFISLMIENGCINILIETLEETTDDQKPKAIIALITVIRFCKRNNFFMENLFSEDFLDILESMAEEDDNFEDLIDQLINEVTEVMNKEN